MAEDKKTIEAAIAAGAVPKQPADRPPAGTSQSSSSGSAEPVQLKAGQEGSLTVAMMTRLDEVNAVVGRLAAEVAALREVVSSQLDNGPMLTALAGRLAHSEHALASLGAATILGAHAEMDATGRHFAQWFKRFTSWLSQQKSPLNG